MRMLAASAAPSPSQACPVPAPILVPWGLNVTQSQPSSEKPVQPGEWQGQGVGVAGGASCWSDQKKHFPSHKDHTEPRAFSGTAHGPLGPRPAEPAHPCVWLSGPGEPSPGLCDRRPVVLARGPGDLRAGSHLAASALCWQQNYLPEGPQK